MIKRARVPRSVQALAVAALFFVMASAATSWAAGNEAGTSAAAKQSKVAKQVRTLAKQVRALRAQLDALEVKAGPAGPPGPQGAPGTTKYVVRTATSNEATVASITASCLAGEHVVGGGGDTTENAALISSKPNPLSAPTGWRAASTHPDNEAHKVTAYVVCAS